MHIVIDNREKLPFSFEGETYKGTITSNICLQVGDYSLRGLEEYISIERKSLADLVMCLGRERDRFKRELARSRSLDFFGVVIEDSWQNLATGNYKSETNPHSAAQSVAAFMARYNVPFFFAGSRRAAEYMTWSLLHQFVKGKRHELEDIQEALCDVNG